VTAADDDELERLAVLYGSGARLYEVDVRYWPTLFYGLSACWPGDLLQRILVLDDDEHDHVVVVKGDGTRLVRRDTGHVPRAFVDVFVEGAVGAWGEMGADAIEEGDEDE
jgi:hypothetical protein